MLNRAKKWRVKGEKVKNALFSIYLWELSLRRDLLHCCRDSLFAGYYWANGGKLLAVN